MYLMSTLTKGVKGGGGGGEGRGVQVRLFGESHRLVM